MWVPCDHMSHEPADCGAGCTMGVLVMVCRVSLRKYHKGTDDHQESLGGSSNISKGGKYLPPLTPPLKKKPGLLLKMHMGEVGEWG